MPNHCNNTLYIRGDRDTLFDFIQRTFLDDSERGKRSQSFDILAKLYPTPQELVDTVSGFTSDEDEQARREIQYEANRAKYGYKDWYDWNCAKWGTKWGDYDTYLADGSPDEGFIEFHFDSAWAPPIDGIAYVATLFPTLEFIMTYEEGGMGFYGVCKFDNDGTYSDTCLEMDDIEGWSSIDFDTEDYDPYERMSELLWDAMDSLRESVGL